MKQPANDLGNRVKRLRQIRQLNQKQLSARAGISQATLSRIETGSVKQPRTSALVQLAEALEVSVDYLLTGRAFEVVPLPDQETEEYLLIYYQAMSPEDRQVLLRVAAALAGRLAVGVAGQ